ncbi:cytochrome P450 [Infundibulicybe gibba]|nr:cytochrome P450 [Infundibulicybe gibba]
MNSIFYSPLVAAAVAAVTYALYRYYLAPRKPQLPPGPRGWPLIGNLLDMPHKQTWLTFSKWGDTYGPISSVSVFGQPIIIINALKPAVQMLSVKGKMYSDRPQLAMGGELIGWKNALPLVRNREMWDTTRTMFHGLFGTHEKMRTGGYNTCEEEAMVLFLKAVAGMKDGGKKGNWRGLLKRAFMIDLLPSLRHIPSWFPGGGFHHKARLWARDLENMVTMPYLHAREALNNGTLRKKCFMTTMLAPCEVPENEHALKWTASTIADAGYITRLAFLRSFFLAMTLYPDVQRTAQAEIDSVVGTHRLPGFADRAQLPYVRALCKEIFRFHSVVPSGLPHVATEDDVHDGYLIPKGSIVIANIWSMLHDPSMYANPDKFDPTRFLGGDGREAEKDITEFVFGFGRRLCPGKTLAETSMYIMVCMTLAVFDISKARDAEGRPVEPVVAQLSGSVSQPSSFQCTVKPRSRDTLTLLACSTGGFYKAPTSGQSIDSLQPLNITWDPTCLSANLADIYLYAPSLNNSRIYVWQSVDFTKGVYPTTLMPRWWNSSASISLQFAIIDAGTPLSFLPSLPAPSSLPHTQNLPRAPSLLQRMSLFPILVTQKSETHLLQRQ